VYKLQYQPLDCVAIPQINDVPLGESIARKGKNSSNLSLSLQTFYLACSITLNDLAINRHGNK